MGVIKMASKEYKTEIAEAYGREFIKGNIPEINEIRCMACGNCVSLCKKLGPNVLEIRDNVAKVVRPEDCISDAACLVSCPTKAMFLMSKYDIKKPPASV